MQQAGQRDGLCQHGEPQPPQPGREEGKRGGTTATAALSLICSEWKDLEERAGKSCKEEVGNAKDAGGTN